MFKAERWYRRHNLKVDDWAQRPADHLVIELRFLAYLASEAKDQDGLADLRASSMSIRCAGWSGSRRCSPNIMDRRSIARSLASPPHISTRPAEPLTDITGLARPVAQAEPAKSKAAPEKTCPIPMTGRTFRASRRAGSALRRVACACLVLILSGATDNAATCQTLKARYDLDQCGRINSSLKRSALNCRAGNARARLSLGYGSRRTQSLDLHPASPVN